MAKQWKQGLKALSLSLFLVLVIRSSIVEPFKIPSGSMIPTLLVGDHIFVNKAAYGIKLPFSDLFGSAPLWLLRTSPPERGDIIVFKFPDPQSDTLYFIKRVVGLPGDLIEIKNKILQLNGTPVPHKPASQHQKKLLASYLKGTPYDRPPVKVFVEKYGTKEFMILQDQEQVSTPDFGPITVPEGHFFVLGDNRDYSNDSRFWGFVPEDQVKGQAFMIWLSVRLSLFEEAPRVFRPTRSGIFLN